MIGVALANDNSRTAGGAKMKKIMAVALLTAGLAPVAPAQSLKIKVYIVTDETVLSSHEVVEATRQKMSMFKTFRFVETEAPDLILNVDCIPRTLSEPYSCMYVALYGGPSFKTLLGAGVHTDKSADTVAVALVSSIAQDVNERWDRTLRTHQVELLEACLFLTQSSCNVPEGLISELKAKSLNLSQYLKKGGLSK
jgi:hypothetical protein